MQGGVVMASAALPAASDASHRLTEGACGRRRDGLPPRMWPRGLRKKLGAWISIHA